jgi:hypothetical protein
MSLACWKAIGHLILSPSPTLITTFDGRSFHPHGIIPSFPVQLGGKTVCIKVEVVNAQLNYNFLLERSWTYSMQAMVSIVFLVLLFPHEDRILTIDQLSFSRPDPSSGASTVPMINNPQPIIVNIRVGLCPPLMGTFNYPPPLGILNSCQTSLRLRFFKSRRFIQLTFTIRGLFLPHQA